MDKFMDREELKELCELLNIPAHCYGNLPMMKINYKKMCLIYHPDKGGDVAKMQRMNELWQKLQDGVINARDEGPFLSSDDDGESQNTSPGPSSRRNSRRPSPDYPSHSQSSFNATPPKPKKRKTDNVPTDFPPCLHPFLSHAIYSNKTCSAFLIYTTTEKGESLYNLLDKFKPEFKARFSFNEAAIVFILTPGKHRVSAIKNFCSTQCTVSFLICKAIIKPLECYQEMKNEPFKLIEENKPGLFTHEFSEGPEKPGVDWNLLSEFAVENNLDDCLLLMGFYLDFANDPEMCIKCIQKKLKTHYKYHEQHYKNAVLFKECKTQKTVCQQATDIVQAKQRLKLLELTREELLTERFKKCIDQLEEKFGQVSILEYMAGVVWYNCMFDNIEEIVFKVLELLTENRPKKRNILFRGPINTGKTTFAAAILDLVGGKTLNVNCPSEKLSFELGCAIDQFAVIFEDVKGQIAMNKSLQPGQGVANLDNLRDYLDGSVKVNLERKHVNKRSQYFPPCIVTMNEYVIPQTLFTRFAKVIDFTPKRYLKESLEANSNLQTKRILQSGITMFLLLVYYLPSRMFVEELQKDVTYWKQIIDKYVGDSNIGKMMNNILNGKNPLNEIVVLVEDDQENGESQNPPESTQNTTQNDSGIQM
ncbi:large T antigen [Bat polyomavirus 5a]|uniref:Large T antigen n=1 Tax=Bat polyomavirus 5a TaxID=1623687 RepID=A0A0D5ZYM7_9POLY|nr:large T antigen [Bat polyomavirus 5a]BAQ55568.1 large T antigen [Bat polyomavirus 5a]